ncbi:MAG: glycosyltransferase family 2 protein [Phenylobacterium sp.]|uniref:glycosyltransferase family 2 protein n=1 Tax=Phenylobacterium sp. TaxID=1871053 RepID=UPI002736D3BF|nr:glycosyltransferase family 2 protein [Phenylobacterium sp.]MDP3173455.1 glycosyltransferase family 2 protein [Phenylobacterium sp.]
MTQPADEHKIAAPAASVLVLAYQSGPTLARCLTALRGQTFANFELLLADNGSSDGAPQAAAAADASVRLIDNGANLGFAAGVNAAARASQGRWLALINPDAYAEPQWLERLMAAAGRYPDVRCFASRQLMEDDAGRLDGLGDVMSAVGFPFRGGYRGRDPGPLPDGEVFSACGGAMLIERDLFLEMGGFDERLFCYCEDVDLGYRLRLRGEPVLVIPEAVVRHVGSASSGGPRSEFAVFHGTRNRLWVFVKDTPTPLLWLTAPLHLAATLLLLARHALRGEIGAPWRGLVAGVRGLPMALAARREAQAERRVSSLEIARAMTWNPLDLLARRVVIRRWRPTRPAGS